MIDKFRAINCKYKQKSEMLGKKDNIIQNEFLHNTIILLFVLKTIIKNFNY